MQETHYCTDRTTVHHKIYVGVMWPGCAELPKVSYSYKINNLIKALLQTYKIV